jgi:hypothetical protein
MVPDDIISTDMGSTDMVLVDIVSGGIVTDGIVSLNKTGLAIAGRPQGMQCHKALLPSARRNI